MVAFDRGKWLFWDIYICDWQQTHIIYNIYNGHDHRGPWGNSTKPVFFWLGQEINETKKDILWNTIFLQQGSWEREKMLRLANSFCLFFVFLRSSANSLIDFFVCSFLFACWLEVSIALDSLWSGDWSVNVDRHIFSGTIQVGFLLSPHLAELCVYSCRWHWFCIL